jgi:hypothetical protein
MSVSCMAALPALPVNVTTASIEEVVPTTVLGNEKAAGLTVNCNAAGAVAAPNEPELELPEPEPEPDDGVLTLDATDGRGRLLQPGARASHASITAIEGQWLR